jgi:hypothetical protein
MLPNDLNKKGKIAANFLLYSNRFSEKVQILCEVKKNINTYFE